LSRGVGFSQLGPKENIMSQVSTPSTGYRWMKSLTAAVAAVAVVFSGLAAAPAQAAVTAPSAPTSLVATTTGAGAVSVAWTAPKDGGSAITGYTVMQSNSSSFTTGSGTTTSTSSSASKAFTGLTAGASYYVKVSATNTKGTSAYSSALKFTAPNVPVAPSAPKVTQGIRSLAATWTAPANGGMAITGYKVQIATDAAFTSPTTTNASTLSATLSSLSDATSYYVRVAATNAVGDSNWSSATTAKTFGVPAPPTKVTVAAGQAQLNVSWPNPTTDKPVTGFRIQYSTNSNFTSSTTVDTNTTATSKIFTGLANGTTYYFKVAAISTVGTGSYSAAGSATTFSAPGAPTAVAITRGIRSLSVTFKAPAANGGSAITGYTIQYATHSDFSDAVTVTGSTAKTTITGLADNTTYYVRAYAANAVGTSAASVSASERTSALPTAVTAGTLTVGKTVGTLTAAWTALTATALDNQAIASYSVQYSTDSTFATGVTTVNAGKATTLAISGLNNNTKYYFRVMATSVVGAGSYSASLANATTLAVPEAPYAVTATGSATSIALTWSATSSSVATTGYKITYSKASTFTMPVVVDAKNVTSYTLTKLTTGTTYYIKVAAYNTVGSSAYSTPVFTTTSSVPVAPTGVTAAPVAATNRINVSWTAPAGVLTGYRVQFADDAAFTANVSVLDVNVTSAQILAGAISNGAYAGRYVRVSAANSNGYGSYSTGIHADGPSLPAATTLTLNSVSVNGTTATPNFTKVADENATTYQVEYSTNADFSGSTVENMLAVNGDNSGFAISNLTRGNTYYVRLVVKNDNGDAVVQAGATSFEVPAVNAAPTNVVVSQHPTNGYRYGQISFTAPEALPGHDYSQVLYQIADDVNFTNIVDSGYTSVTPGTSASVDSIAFNTSARILYFRLYTWHSGAMSNDQGEYSATVAYTLPTTPPTQPGYNQSMGWNKIDVSTAGDTTATLSWAPSTQTEGGDPVDHYTVTQYINNGMGMGMGMGGSLLPETIVYPADRLTPSVELSDLQTGGSYAYKVTAVSTSGSVSEATAVSFVAMGAFPTPTNVVVGQGDMSYTDIKASGVLAPDTHGRYASGIYFQISDDANFTNIIRNEYGSSMMGNPSTTFNGMTSGQTYYVRAYVQWNDWMTMRSGVSAYSDVVTYRVPTTPPTQPGMSMMGMPTINVNPTSATTATLSWTPSQAGMGGDPVDHYTVTQYVNNGMGGMMPGMGGGSLLPETIVYPADRLTPSVDLADLQTGGNYAYKVTAVSTSGAVSQATTVSFTANAPYPAPSVVVSAPTDTMMYSVTSSLKATATAVSDPGGRSAQAMYFDIATDAAFTNIVSSNNYGSMMMGNPSYTFGGLTSGQTYYVRARVQWNNWMTMSSGYGSYSTVVSGKVSTVPPTQPGLAGGMMGGMGGTINVNPTSATTATLSWAPSQAGMGGDPVDHYVFSGTTG
jgi:titin